MTATRRRDLPVDLFLYILGIIEDPRDYLPLRSLSKLHHAIVTPRAFRTLRISMTRRTLKGLKKLARSDTLAKLVHKVELNGIGNLKHFSSNLYHMDREVITPSQTSAYTCLVFISQITDVFSDLKRFEHLTDFSVKALPKSFCISLSQSELGLAVVLDYYESTYVAALSAVARFFPPSLKHVSVTGSFSKALGEGKLAPLYAQIEDLAVSTCAYESRSFGRAATFWERTLAPSILLHAASLTTLSIRSWDLVLPCYFDTIALPLLRDLTVAGVLFCRYRGLEPGLNEHDMEAFIVRHAKTLVVLRLEYCAISIPEQPSPRGERWAGIFDLFREKLMALKQFTIIHKARSSGYTVNCMETCSEEVQGELQDQPALDHLQETIAERNKKAEQ